MTFKITFSVYLILVLSIFSFSFPQNNSDEKINGLYLEIPKLKQNGDYGSIIRNLVEIIELKPESLTPRNIIIDIINNNLDEVLNTLSNNKELLAKAFINIKNLNFKAAEIKHNENYTKLVELLIELIETKPESHELRNILSSIINSNLEHVLNSLSSNKLLIEKAFNYTIEKGDTTLDLTLVTYFYYEKHDAVKLRTVLDKILANENDLSKFSNRILIYFDQNIDRKLYSEIIQTLYSKFDSKSKCRLALYYYSSNQTDKLRKILLMVNPSVFADELSLSELLILDYSINPTVYKDLFSRMIVGYSKDKIDEINKPALLYILARNYFTCGDEISSDSIFDKIYIQLENDQTNNLDNIFCLGFSCLFRNQQFKAKIFFDRVYKDGDKAEREKLKNELEWWSNNNFQKNYLNELLNSYFKTYNLENNDSTLPQENINFGIYYALVIGVQDYLDYHISSLMFPISDAEKFALVLSKNFTFNPQNIIVLKNPSRNEILAELVKLRNSLNEGDNLLIFYAGHGVWDEEIQQGYWLPVDAKQSAITNWISNSDIRDFIRGIKSKHTLLISDACFSGGIFQTRDIKRNPSLSIIETSRYPSRRAITSGALKTVPDKSVFVEYLIKRLEQNSEKYLTTQKLFVNIKDAVINNSPIKQTPLYGIIQETGDEGEGDFIFIKK